MECIVILFTDVKAAETERQRQNIALALGRLYDLVLRSVVKIIG